MFQILIVIASLEGISTNGIEINNGTELALSVLCYFALAVTIENVITVYWGVPNRTLVCAHACMCVFFVCVVADISCWIFIT